MKILVSSINFAPDHAGIAIYSTDFSVFLAEQGEKVKMVTGFPYYPQWEKQQEDKHRFFQREKYKDVDVYRGYLYVPSQVTAMKRVWHELTFCIFAFANFLRVGKPDVIVLFTPPFFLGIVGVLTKWIWRCPLVINIQDLPLDAALALDMIKANRLINILQLLEGWIYRRADLVTTISPAMVKNVNLKGVKNNRLLLVPNWIDIEELSMTAERNSFLSNHPQAQGKFTIAYAGNLGSKQGVDILLSLAKKVEADDIHIFIIGDGSDKPRLLEIANTNKLKNVTFLPFMSAREYQLMLEDMDVMFLAQRNEAGNNFFPSKLLGLMAQGKPLLVSANLDSELASVISDTGCGLVSPYGDTEKLKENLKHLIEFRETLVGMGEKGHQVVETFGRKKVLGDWYSNIKTLAKR